MSWRAGFIVAHRWLGLLAGLVVGFVALTGAGYAFEAQLRRAWGESIELRGVDSRVAPSRILESAQAVHPGASLLWMMWPVRLDEPVWVKVRRPHGGDASVMVDPYSGAYLAEATRWRRAFDVLLDLHRTLGLGEPGKKVVGCAALVVVILVGTGVVIALPRTLRRWGRHLLIPRQSRGAAGAYAWHRMLGWWVAPVITLSALTGLVWAFDWTRGLLDVLTRSAALPPPPAVAVAAGEPPLGIDAVLAQGRALAGDAVHVRLYAPRPGGAWRVEWMPPDSRFISQRSRSYFHPTTGELLQHIPFAENSRGERLSRFAYPVHTGLILGWPTQFVMFSGALGLAALAGTGAWLFMARRRSTRTQELAPATSGRIPT